MTWVAAGLFALTLVLALNSYWGGRKIAWIKNFPPAPDGNLPSISIVVAARNEEKNIAHALVSLLNLDYPHKEILVVNDRSTDRTGAILAELGAKFPELRVLTITELPKGWLGKNHALHRGAEATTSDLILYTDADIVFTPDALRRSITFFGQRQLDHLASLPEVRVPGAWLNLCIGIFGVYFSMFYEPWKASDPKSKRFIGVGGFNLLKRSALAKIGGFRRISLRPDDDLQLGRLIKEAGFRQELAWGLGTSFVEWYASVPEMVHGLEKNMYSGFRYNWWEALFGSAAIFFFNVFPVLGFFFCHGWTQVYFGLCWLILVACFAFSAKRTGQHASLGVLFPLGALLYLYMIANSVGKTIWHGGIYWRGTFYSLEELRTQR